MDLRLRRAVSEPTYDCADGSVHVFLDDGGESPSGVSCAICDQDYGEWCVKFKPATPPQPQVKETSPC